MKKQKGLHLWLVFFLMLSGSSQAHAGFDPFGWATSAVSYVANNIAKTVSSVANTAATTASNVAKTVTQTVVSVASTAVNTVTGVVSAAGNIVSGIANTAVSIISGKASVASISNALSSSVSTALQAISKTAGNIVNMAGSLASGVVTAAGQLNQGILNGATSLAAGAANLIDPSGSLSKVTTTLLSIADLPVNMAISLAQGAIDFLKGALNPEPGDYNALEMAYHMVFPEAPNRPVTADERSFSFAPQAFTVGAAFNRFKYFVWQEVEAPASTGAKCADGSPYRFYVNLSPTGKNQAIFFEGGGVCTDYAGCMGGLAVNKDGLPREYMKFGLVNQTLDWLLSGLQGNYKIELGIPHQLASPLITRIATVAESTRFKMQNWNMVFMPYCSADMHLSANNKLFFEDLRNPKSNNVYRQFAGIPNIMAMIGFLRTNLPQPAQVFITGQSAGSYAVSLGQPVIRRFLSPSANMYTLADAGFPFDTPYLSNAALKAPAGTSQEDALNLVDEDKYPSGRIFKKIYENVIGYDESNPSKKTSLKFMKEILPGIDQKRLISVMGEYHKAYPGARTVYDMAQMDQTISGYAYGDNSSMKGLADGDGTHQSFSTPASRQRAFLINKDLDGVQRYLNGTGAWQAGYFMPGGRRLIGAHVLTAGAYTDTSNADTGHSMPDVISNLVSRDFPPLYRERESNRTRGVNAQPTGLLYTIDQWAGGTSISPRP